MRYAGIALVAVIAGAGGSYFALNNKNDQQVSTQSGTIPAIPAQPFPGQGVPAIPAIPAFPGDREKLLKEEYVYIPAPFGGKSWVRGRQPMPIGWYWQLKQQSPTFDINLLKDGQFYRKLATVSAKSIFTVWYDRAQYRLSQWDWSIPADLPVGSHYNVEVVYKGHPKGEVVKDVNAREFTILSDPLTIKGKFVKGAEGGGEVTYLGGVLGVPNVELYRTDNPNEKIPVDAKGEFTYIADTADTNPTPSYTYSKACYMQGWFDTLYDRGGTGFEWTNLGPPSSNINSIDVHSGTFYVWFWTRATSPFTTILSDTTHHKIEMIPAGSLEVTSDIPVRADIYYPLPRELNPYQGDSWWLYRYLYHGPTVRYGENYSVSHKFVDAIPAKAQLILTDQAGKQYSTDVSGGDCKTHKVSFTNGQFKVEQ